MIQVTYQIAWRTRDRNLINRVCAYLGVRPYMSVNRTTPVGTLTDEQVDSANAKIIAKLEKLGAELRK